MNCNVIAKKLNIFTIIPQFICKFTLQQFVSPIVLSVSLALAFALIIFRSKGKTM